jgi:uncharacterized protein YndB with AHSA1/START domain
MRTIERSVTIDAPIGRVWDVLTQSQYLNQWARAFMDPIRVDIDLRPGGEVWWRSDGNPPIRARIAELAEGRFLKVDYPPELNPQHPDMGDSFAETYGLAEDHGEVVLSITCGPVSSEGYAQMEQPWEQALDNIKRVAEDEDGLRAEAPRPEAAP